MIRPTPKQDQSSDAAAQEQQAPHAAHQLVRALLERHGIPKHRHSSFVAEFFGLSRAASYLRVTKSSAWTLDDFQALAQRFGEPLAQVLGSSGESSGGAPAVLKVGALQIDCRVWVDRTAHARSALVAQEGAGSYVVVPLAAAGDQPSWAVARLEIAQAHAQAPRVAVLAGEQDVCDSVCEVLRREGIDPTPYPSAADLARDIARSLFDGYVIDWLLPNQQSALPLLAAVRNQPSRSALVLLSGGTRTGGADPVQIAAAALKYRTPLVEKPIQGPFLISSLLIDGLNAAQPVVDRPTPGSVPG